MSKAVFVISSEARNLLLLNTCKFKIPRLSEMTYDPTSEGEDEAHPPRLSARDGGQDGGESSFTFPVQSTVHSGNLRKSACGGQMELLLCRQSWQFLQWFRNHAYSFNPTLPYCRHHFHHESVWQALVSPEKHRFIRSILIDGLHFALQ